ncbi:MAG: hypothetical protein V1867_02815 [Candidatus Falkowbacteria bacterium]
MALIEEIYPGFDGDKTVITYRTEDGLEGLRALAIRHKGDPEICFKLYGVASIVSHVGDILRMYRIPSIIVRPK